MTTIYLIRHAAAEGNLYRVAHGQFNSTITHQGYRQLSYLKKRFEDIPLEAVYGSDLLRAHTTASALYVPKNLAFQPLPLLREIRMGVWEQMTWGEIARRDARMYDYFNHNLGQFALEGAESFAEVRDRMVAAVRQMAAEHPNGVVAATSHGAALRVLLGTLQGLTLAEIGNTPYGDNTAVSLLEVEGEKIRVVYRDDDSHIPTALKVRRQSKAAVGERAPTGTQPGLWFRVLRNEATAILLDAMCGEDCVGHTALRLGDGMLRIVDYEILPACRGQHYGVQLLGQAVKYARANEREEVGVVCRKELIPYFAQYGFVVTQDRGADAAMTLDLRRVIREIPEISH